ncbi:MAG: GNAT family N-acetyltransferase [Bacteroidales bacterium]|jgi:hypothetical protein|nr:GNAT family N-acetyltransferase [Bacteroidales bacterium]
MKKIIDPIDKILIKKELSLDKFLRKTNSGGNSIYLLDAHDSPNTMREIGRLREKTFRLAGGGTGEEVDIDIYDTAAVPFKQLIVWNDKQEEIISAYRFILGKDVPLDNKGYPHTPTSKLFRFSKKFIENEWQDSIELGRSFVQSKYQATTNPRVGLFSLDNVWDGLGTLVVDHPECKYFFGKMTIYNSYNRIARNFVIHFLNKHFKGDESLMQPYESLDMMENDEELKAIFCKSSFEEDFKILNKQIRELRESVPPLVKTYMSLSPSMQCFGSSANAEFGPVEEIAILIKVSDIYENKKIRHIYSYKSKRLRQLLQRLLWIRRTR